MALEIELKAHLDDFSPVKERLSVVGDYWRSYTKSDAYWFSGQMTAGIRLRRESGIEANGAAYESTLVTYKTKEISGGIEVNDESEFSVSTTAQEDAVAVFEALLTRLGLRRDICKEKQGWAWTIRADGRPPILAELSQVAGLGWFLELEIIAADNSRQTVAESRQRLLALLAQLEIPADRIESRPYAEMLREIGNGERGIGGR